MMFIFMSVYANIKVNCRYRAQIFLSEIWSFSLPDLAPSPWIEGLALQTAISDLPKQITKKLNTQGC